MAKKKPTCKNLRQGQAIYRIIHDFNFGNSEAVPYICKEFLYSQKQPLPPIGVIINKAPVTLLKELIKNFGNKNIFFSRKKANSALKLHYENY